MSGSSKGMKTEEPLWQCTVCGRVGTVGRCCGRDTRTPLNDAAREEESAARAVSANDDVGHGMVWHGENEKE